MQSTTLAGTGIPQIFLLALLVSLFLAFKGRNYALRDDVQRIVFVPVLPPTPAELNAGKVRS